MKIIICRELCIEKRRPAAADADFGETSEMIFPALQRFSDA